MVATALFFLNYETASWTVCDRVLDIEAFKVFLHGLIELRLTILLSMIGQATAHANLVVTPLTLTVILIGSCEARVGLLPDLLLEPLAVEGAAGQRPIPPLHFANVCVIAFLVNYLLTLFKKLSPQLNHFLCKFCVFCVFFRL